MTTPGRLIDVAAAVTGKNRHTVEKIYDGLRASGEVPKGARGRYGVRITSEIAAKLLLAVCGSEHVRDAAYTVRWYAALRPNHSQRFIYKDDSYKPLIVPSAAWEIVGHEYPKLAELPKGHDFADAITALIDSYVQRQPKADVSISLRGPYPGAHVSIILERRDTPEWRVEIDYQFDDDEGDWINLDSSKERRHRRITAHDGDLKTVTTVSHKTLEALGHLLRGDDGT